MNSIPEGFEPFATNSPYSVHIGPLYIKLLNDEVIFGLPVKQQHCNSGGVLHGGMVNTLADLAIGNNIGLVLAARAGADGTPASGARQGGAPIATVSMTTDFAGSAKQGDWVEVHVDVQRVGRSMAFANAYLISNDTRFARTSAVFKVIG